MIATGATPRLLALPGAGLEGVYALRTLARLTGDPRSGGFGRRAVVIGGGFIGMEVAASLRQLGLAVTLIHLGRGLFDQFGSDALSEELAALYREHGVELLLEEEVAGFGSDDQRQAQLRGDEERHLRRSRDRRGRRRCRTQCRLPRR